MSNLQLAIVLMLVFGGLAVLAAYQFVVAGATFYEKRFVRRVGTNLSESFLFLDPRVLFLINLGLMAVAGIIGFILLDFPGMVLGILLVAAVPSIALRQIKKRRADKFVYQFPDCLNSMASSLRAGSSLARSMEQVALQQPAPVSQEFAVVISEYKMGRDLEESLRGMCKRLQRQELELFSSAISISRSVGGNLADTLATLAQTLREKAQVEGKIDALTSMGRLQGWVVGLMPVLVGLMVYKQEPEAMSALVKEPIGWIVLGILSVALIIATVMIRKIVNIDV